MNLGKNTSTVKDLNQAVARLARSREENLQALVCVSHVRPERERERDRERDRENKVTVSLLSNNILSVKTGWFSDTMTPRANYYLHTWCRFSKMAFPESLGLLGASSVQWLSGPVTVKANCYLAPSRRRGFPTTIALRPCNCEN